MSVRPATLLSWGFMFFVLVSNYLGNVKKSENLDKIALLEQGILSIAILQYAIGLGLPYDKLMRWRYLDWLLTTPLLISTFYLLAKEKGYDGLLWPAIFFDVVMIVGGYFAEYPETSPISLETREQTSTFWFVLSSIALIFIFYYIYTWNDFLKNEGVDTGVLPYFFYIGWTVYGLNWLNPNPDLRQDIFSYSDLFNKGIYSLVLNKVIEDNF